MQEAIYELCQEQRGQHLRPEAGKCPGITGAAYRPEVGDNADLAVGQAVCGGEQITTPAMTGGGSGAASGGVFVLGDGRLHEHLFDFYDVVGIRADTAYLHGFNQACSVKPGLT